MIFRQYIAILIILFSLPLATISQESEEQYYLHLEVQIKEEAEALFEAENYTEAFNKYSQLLSLQLRSPEYNYRFGACQLFTSNDKEQSLKYLKFAVDSKDAPNLSHFYYGLGLHLNYRFEKAIREYEKYQAGAGKKEKENQFVSHHIEQCRNGIKLVSSFTDISVVQREALPLSDFYRNYDLTEFDGKIMVKPEDFMTEEDKKRDANFIMYFQQNADYIYYAGYSEKNETGKDLYVIQRLPTGEWSKNPTKLSSTINTKYDEDFPFIHPDGNVLYFASKGHSSMGGYDIFKSTRRGDGTWTKPINMEFALNTPWDDFLFISDKAEKTAWFASNRETSGDQVVIYKIGIDRVPLDLTLIKGTFLAEGSNRAKITIEDMVQNKVIGVFESERQFGDYLLDLRGSGKYEFIVEAEESNAIHTGLVEVPREKGLKQFRQEMTLEIVEGKEQLQIINHFDEPLDDPTLLTADILKKQASLSVNSSEDDLRTSEILDEVEISDEVSPEEKLNLAENSIKELERNAELLNQKAAFLLEKASSKSNSTDPTEIAEAAIAAELASDFKEEADSRNAAASRMSGIFEVMSSVDIEDAAFNAQYNQLSATSDNFQSLDNFENQIRESYSNRSKPSLEVHDAKQSELEGINDDLTGIQEEITYLQTEVENTKDKALKEEYNLQISDAKSAIPTKEAERVRVKGELETTIKHKVNAEKYAGITTGLFEAAASGAETVTSTASLAEINEIKSALSAKALANPALLAFVAPKKVAEATALALAESRKNRTGQNSSEDSNVDSDYSSDFEDLTSNDEANVASTESDDSFSDDNVDMAETASDTVFSGTEKPNLNEEETQELNEEIRNISATESQPAILGGNYSSKFQQQIAEAANAEDPVIAESRKAEIYDQWVENIDYRIDSLSKTQEGESDTKRMLDFANQITALNEEKEEKNDLAMASYAAVASMSDEQGLVSSNKLAERNTDENIDPESDFTSGSEGSDDFFADENNVSENEEDSFDSFHGSDDTNGDSEGSTEIESENENSIREVNADSIPPVTPEILNSDDVPPVVLELNSSYTQQLAGSRALTSKVEQKKEEARINKAWAADLAHELQVLSAQIEITESQEQRNKLDELSANVASIRMEKVNKASALQTDIILVEKEETLTADKNRLQQVLNQYVDTYNSKAFVQLEQQVANESNPELRLAKTKVLNQNWMVALKNEEFKTETRIANSVDPKQKVELEEKLLSISAEKLYVQSTLDSLKTSQVDGPAPPKTVVVRGSEKFEGYVPVATGKPAEYDEKSQVSYNKIDRFNMKLTEIEATLAATKKKRERVLIENEIETIQNDLEVAQLESDYFEKAELKIIRVEPLILQLESGDPTPSQVQMNEAEKLEHDAVLLTDAARRTRESADVIKKKKKRIPAQVEARKAEQLALLKRKEADLASELVNEMSTIEAKAIATNFIIPAGLEVTLPVINTKLNPTESSDVAATEQFQEYNIEKRKADSLRLMSARFISAENQLNLKAQNLMLATSLDPEVRLKTSAKAYVFYDRADSLSSIVARLNRQAALLENDANRSLFPNPEEVYNSILAYYNTDTNQSSLAETSPNEIQDLTGDLDPNGEGQSNDVVDNDEDQFDLTPPRQANQTLAVRPDVLTNTIFEASPTAGSFYDSSTPIPVNLPMPSGLIYKVQIGAFRNAIKQDAFKGIKPITGESTGTGLTRYSAGEFTNIAEANFARDEIRIIGYRDAFVVSYRNGKRVGSGATSNTSARSGNSNMGQGSNNASSASSSSSSQANSIVKKGSLLINNVANQPGTFYTVQIGVFSKPVKSSDIYNITPLNQENLSNGTYRYTTGIFQSVPTADQAKNEIRGLGISDAFVTPYKSGSRVTVDQARQDLGSNISNTSPSDTVEFTIFLGQFTGEVPLAQASVIINLSASGVDKIKNGDGSNSYYYGAFESEQEAQDEASKLAGQGLSQAHAQSK